PADTDAITATILAQDAIAADVWATVMLILGTHDGLKQLNSRPHLAGGIFTAKHKFHLSQSMQQLTRF
ncbi:MAG: FAD:protein FMN transferase, partial [Chloroflexi bacterium]|nr:FAD:protein FMN transferase [Chloroflexota bacterium]